MRQDPSSCKDCAKRDPLILSPITLHRVANQVATCEGLSYCRHKQANKAAEHRPESLSTRLTVAYQTAFLETRSVAELDSQTYRNNFPDV